MNRMPLFAPDFTRLRPLFIVAAFVTGGILVLAFTLHGVHETAHGHFSICVFRDLFALPCPGCGMTRGLALLLIGEWSAAMRAHPLSVFGLAGLAGIWLGAVWSPMGRLLVRVGPERMVFVGLIVLLVVGGLRLAVVLFAPGIAGEYIYDFSQDRGPLDAIRDGGALRLFSP